MTGRLILTLFLTLAAAGVRPGTARADYKPLAKKLVTGTVQRARRAISFGPSAGGSFAMGLSSRDLDGAMSFGIGLYLYDIPVVPSPEMIQELVKERIKARVEERVRAMVERGEPPPDQKDLEAFGRQIFEDVKQEVLGEKSVRPRLHEKPRLALDLEGAYLFGAEAWQVRTTFGFGIKSVSIGPSFTLHLGDSIGLFLGPELDVRLLPGKGPRSPVIDIYLRADFAMRKRDVTDDSLGLGMRVLLDVI